jgi:quinol monooxygenase YgiN
MSLVNVLSIQVRPGANRRYEELVAALAKKAVAKKEGFLWDAHQTVMGEAAGYHFVSRSETFAGFGTRGSTPELIERVLGAKEAAQFREQTEEISTAVRNTISLERLDLSYPPDSRNAAALPFAMVTLVRGRPGHQEAIEELLRKLAEAIPKVDDPARLVSYQTIIGDLRTIWTVRPMATLADLDAQRAPAQLLSDAFGAAEGGHVWRSAMEAIEEAQRSITVYRPVLSNPE